MRSRTLSASPRRAAHVLWFEPRSIAGSCERRFTAHRFCTGWANRSLAATRSRDRPASCLVRRISTRMPPGRGGWAARSRRGRRRGKTRRVDAPSTLARAARRSLCPAALRHSSLPWPSCDGAVLGYAFGETEPVRLISLETWLRTSHAGVCSIIACAWTLSLFTYSQPAVR